MDLSTSSTQPGCPGVTSAWPSMRRPLAMRLTISTPSWICSFDRNTYDLSSKGAPLNKATEVSLLKKICRT